MLWYIWAVLVIIALVMVIIGLTKAEHTEQAMIGFVFLFLLSFTLINNNLEYQTGESSTSTNIINYMYSNGTLTTSTEEIATSNDYTIENLAEGSVGVKRLGYYMALAMAIGFIGTLISLRGIRGKEQ